jgi:dTDP-4-dehydrorhamnose reductase
MLGSDLVEVVSRIGHSVRAPDLEVLDLANPEHLSALAEGAFVRGAAWCVNCAAYTDVDGAESDTETAMAVNARAPGAVAHACRTHGVRLLHIGTDFVFDGRAIRPYDESAVPNPINAYGRSKLLGEQAVMEALPGAVILRTAWLYGPNGPSFPRSIVRAWLDGKSLNVVTDQMGSPTYTRDLAGLIGEILEEGLPGGLYHAAGHDAVTRWEWAELAIDCFRDVYADAPEAPEIGKSVTAAWPAPAERPAYSVLDSRKLAESGMPPMRPLRDALRELWTRTGRRP